jgi:hypothetical protein
MGAPVKHEMSLEQIAQAEGISVAAAHMTITRALRKLRRQGLICTCRELSEALERSRPHTEHTVRSGRRR